MRRLHDDGPGGPEAWWREWREVSDPRGEPLHPLRLGRRGAEEQAMNRRSSGEKGSAMVLAIFALLLLTSMGIAFLFMGHTDVKVNQAGQRATKAFYLAE